MSVNDELEKKTKRACQKVSENLHIIANEPSLAFYRLQEHMVKSYPQVAERRLASADLDKRLQGAFYDAEYALDAVKGMKAATPNFVSSQHFLKNALFFHQQLRYEKRRKMEASLHAAKPDT